MDCLNGKSARFVGGYMCFFWLVISATWGVGMARLSLKKKADDEEKKHMPPTQRPPDHTYLPGPPNVTVDCFIYL